MPWKALRFLFDRRQKHGNKKGCGRHEKMPFIIPDLPLMKAIACLQPKSLLPSSQSLKCMNWLKTIWTQFLIEKGANRLLYPYVSNTITNLPSHFMAVGFFSLKNIFIGGALDIFTFSTSSEECYDKFETWPSMNPFQRHKSLFNYRSSTCLGEFLGMGMLGFEGCAISEKLKSFGGTGTLGDYEFRAMS